MLSIIIILIIGSSSLFIINLDGISLLADNENAHITDFSDIINTSNHENISTSMNDDWIYIKSINSSNNIRYEELFLDLKEIGNITDIQIDLSLEFNFSDYNDYGYFICSLNTNFNFNTEEYYYRNDSLGSCKLFRDNWYHDDGFRIDFDYNSDYVFTSFHNNQQVKIQFVKKDKNFEIKLFDFENNIILEEKSKSNRNYIDVCSINFLYCVYYDSDFSINLTSLNIDMTIENRDWKALVVRERTFYIITGVLATIATILVLIIGTRIARRETKKFKKVRDAKNFLALEDMRKWNVKTQAAADAEINDYVFKDKLPKDSKCGICKLPFPREEFILQCPKCKSFFHQKHLQDWLKKNKNCPICKEKLIS